MPRPKRKPKKFKTQSPANAPRETPVSSGPLPDPATYESPPSNEPIPLADDDAINPKIHDRVMKEYNDFGFSAVRGIKRTVVPVHADSNINEEPDPINQVDSEQENIPPTKPEERGGDIYGVDATSSSSSLSPVPTPSPPPKRKPVRKLRTSELMDLLPRRRKTLDKSAPPRQPLVPSLDSSDDDGEHQVPPPPRAKGKKVAKKNCRAVAVEDKENSIPVQDDGSSEERWNVVKGKFAEIDRWEMDFEVVDLSFSSQ